MAISKAAKIEAEIKKAKAKIAEGQAKLKELEAKKVELKNSEIVDVVRGMNISLADLPVLLQQLRAALPTSGQVVPKAPDETKKEEKEFFTVTTEDGAVFYLVVDRQKQDNNVYFLNAVTLEDLAALAESSGKPLAGPVTQNPQATVEPTADPAASPEPSAPAGPETPQQTNPINIGILIAALAVLAVGGGAGWYFKIYRPKHQKPAELEDYPEDEEELDPLTGADGWDEDGDGQE